MDELLQKDPLQPRKHALCLEENRVPCGEHAREFDSNLLRETLPSLT